MKKLLPRTLWLTLLTFFLLAHSFTARAISSPFRSGISLNPAFCILPAEQQIASDSTAPLPYSYAHPQQYIIGGVTVTGAKFLDQSILVSLSGLTVGDKIVLPGDNLSRAIINLWKQKFFSNVQIFIPKITGDSIYFNIVVTERPRMTTYYFVGISKTEGDDLKDKLGLVKGSVVTESMKMNAVVAIKKYFADKGFGGVTAYITQKPDTTYLNSVNLYLHINKGKKIKINQISFAGNDHVPSSVLKAHMKHTKEDSRLTFHAVNDQGIWDPKPRSFKKYLQQRGYLSLSKTLDALDPYFRFKLFSSAKFDRTKYDEDKNKILDYYNSIGYRDATIVKDTTYYARNGNLDIDIMINEGKKYYFGNIVWKGNTRYSDTVLNAVLNIHKGDIYDLDKLNQRLGPSQDGDDVNSLYTNNGYLFYQAKPVETGVRGDTIDYEIRITEGPQATIKNVRIAGNTKTNEHVIRRELRTIPGEKFSRADVVRSIRELSQLGYFDPEKITPNFLPNQQDGTVDIDWNVVEKPSDQLELSAGWGGYIGLTGTVGITFNNFSLHNIFKKDAWTPLPSGDGQKLSLRLQSNGRFYRSYNFSFTEPWLGGKKRNQFSISFYNSFISAANYLLGQSANASYLRTIGASVSLGKTLKWPDDFFSLIYEVDYQQYKLKNYQFFTGSTLNNGTINDLSLKLTLARSSVDQPIYPRSGSKFMLSGQFTPPYSLFSDPNAPGKPAANQFNFIEYQKYRFDGEWYVPLGKPHGADSKQFVIKAAAKLGFIGKYNPAAPLSPFDRFEVGGDGMSTYAIYGKEIISQRGYETYYSSNPKDNSTTQPTSYQGFTIFNKYTLELRYPIALNPNSTIFALVFLEAANGYNGFADFDPFRLRRSAGMGVRFYLPMFGLLGFDYGIGFDRITPTGGLRNATKFSFMLGYEPE
ncbi:MAG: BamA/OMP85 family outer membrane protein [Chitinophagaceae bacterium]